MRKTAWTYGETNERTLSKNREPGLVPSTRNDPKRNMERTGAIERSYLLLRRIPFR